MDIRTEIRYMDMPVIHMPAITIFFADDVFPNRFMCYNGTIYDADKEKINSCSKLVNFQVYAQNATLKTSPGYAVVNENETYVEKGRGKNFHVNVSVSEPHKLKKVSLIFQSAEEVRNSIEFSFVSNQQFNIELTPGVYEIIVEKEIIERLPAPYKSNCSSERVLFSNVYTVSSCEEECVFNRVYNTCGDVPEVWKKYLKQPVKLYKGHEFPNKAACIGDILDKALNGELSLRCYCPPACKTVSFKTDINFQEKGVGGWDLVIRYSSTRRVTSVKQVPDYTLEDALGAMGGFVGLCVGASLLSVIELLVYTTLYIVNKVWRKIDEYKRQGQSPRE